MPIRPYKEANTSLLIKFIKEDLTYLKNKKFSEFSKEQKKNFFNFFLDNLNTEGTKEGACEKIKNVLAEIAQLKSIAVNNNYIGLSFLLHTIR